MNTTNHLERNIKPRVNLGMRMSNLRKELHGKVGYNLILIEQSSNLKDGMIFLIK